MEKQEIYDLIRDMNMQDEVLLALILVKLKDAMKRKSEIDVLTFDAVSPTLVRLVTNNFIDDFSDLLLQKMSTKN